MCRGSIYIDFLRRVTEIICDSEALHKFANDFWNALYTEEKHMVVCVNEENIIINPTEIPDGYIRYEIEYNQKEKDFTDFWSW